MLDLPPGPFRRPSSPPVSWMSPSDPAALDSAGFWAVGGGLRGRFDLRPLRHVRTGAGARAPAGGVAGPRRRRLDVLAWTARRTRRAYGAIRAHIAAGEVYQANLCRVLPAPLSAPGCRRGRARPRCWPAATRRRTPERSGCPGTAWRSPPPRPSCSCAAAAGSWSPGRSRAPRRTADDLLEKDHAENVMIVDLVRNDLGRVCATGSVTVPDLCAVEQHPGLVHLVSTVRGELRRGRRAGPSCSPPPSRPARSPARPSPAPCGSSTRWRPRPGARTAAGVGWVDADRGTGELAVGIRTFWIDRADGAARLRFGTGAGITWGSDPDGEWAETELKAARLLAVASGTYRGERNGEALQVKIWVDGGLRDTEPARVSVLDHGLTVGDGVFETLKAVDGGPFALTRHLDRLTRSARGLGLPEPDLDEVRPRLRRRARRQPRCALGRLRITYTGGHVPARLRPRRARPDPGGRPRRGRPAPRLHRRGHRALDPQRARRAHRPEDHLLRRERRRPGPRP